MDTPRFYIFGVPDGFDMLDGSRQEIAYFQRFYDGSTEDTKFTFHRDSGGTVIYSFLKYNLSSGKSRTGSFFGMSLAFSGCHCIFPLTLYNLFDYVYQNHVLCDVSNTNNGILRPIANSDVKAQYLITRFEDRREHIKFIEKVFLHNLATNDVLATSFYPLDPSFKNENQNLVVNLPLAEGLTDDTLTNRFREYSYVTISPNWKPVIGTEEGPEPKDTVELAPQQVMQWKDLIPNYQRYIIQGLGNLAFTDKDEVRKYQKQTEETLNQLKKYSYNKNIAPSLQANYEELRDQLEDLYQKAVDAQSGGGDTLPPDTIPPIPTPTPSFWDNVKEWVSENKSKVAGIVGTASVVALLLALVLPKQKSPYDSNPSYCWAERANDSINAALSTNDFVKAKEFADSISDQDFKNEKLALIADAISEYNRNLDDEIQNLKNQNSENWLKAFQKTKDYVDDKGEKKENTELKNNLKEECVAYYQNRIAAILDKNNCQKESKVLPQELEAVKNHIGIIHYNDLIGSWSDKVNEFQPPLSTTKYCVELWKDNLNETKGKHSETKPGKITIDPPKKEIHFNKGDNFEIRLIANGSPIPLTSEKIEGSLKNIIRECTDDWVDIRSLQEEGNIRIKNASIDIQFKLKE